MPITIGITLAAPVLVAPPDGTLTNDNLPTFEWEAVPNAIYYRIQVDDDPAFDAPSSTRWWALSLIRLSATPDNTTYYWRVQALAGSVTSAWSDVWTLTIDTTHLPAPILQQPKDRARSTTQRRVSSGSRCMGR